MTNNELGIKRINTVVDHIKEIQQTSPTTKRVFLAPNMWNRFILEVISMDKFAEKHDLRRNLEKGPVRVGDIEVWRAPDNLKIPTKNEDE